MDMPVYIAELLDEVGLSEANASRTPTASGYRLSRHGYANNEADRQSTVDEVNKMFRRSFQSYEDVKT